MSGGGVNLVMEHLQDNLGKEGNNDDKMDGNNDNAEQGPATTTTSPSANADPKRHSRHYAENEGFGQELYRRLMEARSLSTDHFQFGFAVISIILGSIVGLGFLLLTTAVPIAMIAIGVTHIDNCPAVPELPYLLIAAGAVLATGSLINIGDQFLEGYVYHTGGKRKSPFITCLNVIVCGLMIASLILGCIWIYGSPIPADHATVYAAYCHPTVWQFSFWLLNVAWALIALVAIITMIGIVSVNLMPSL